MGVQDAVGQGPDLRGLPGARLLLAVRDAAVQHRDADGRRLPRPPGPGAHRRASSCRRRRRARRCWPGRRRRGRCRPTSPSPSVPTSSTRSSSATGERYILAEARLDAYDASSARRRAASARYAAPTSSAGATRRCSRSSPTDRRTRSRSSPATSSTPRRAPASSTWRPASARTTSCVCDAAGIPTSCRWTSTAATRPRSRRGPASTSSTPTRSVIRDLKEQRRRPAPRDLRPLLPALLAVRAAARLPGDLLVVRRGHQVPRPDGRAQPADPLGARARQGRQLRQVAGERPRLVDQPQPLLGLADPGVAQRRPDVPAQSTSTARSPSSSATSASPSTDLHRPMVDELVRPNPDDPTGRSMMRRVPEVLDCWFESGSMPFAQVHYPFENREWFENHYPGDFIVEYIGQTRGWFYTLHVLATALFDRPAFSHCVGHGIVLGDDGLKMSKSLRNYPDPMEVFDTYGADAMRWYLLSSPILRGSDFVRHRGGHPRHRPPGPAAALEHVVLPLPVRQRGRAPAAGSARRPRRPSTCSTATCSPRPHDLVDDVTAAMDAYDLFGACAAVRSVPRRADQLVHPPQPRAVLGRRRRTPSTRCTRCSTCCAASPPRCCRSPPRRSTAGSPRRAQRAPHRLAATPRRCPPTPSWSTSMDLARDVCSAALRLRKANGRRVRQPLADAHASPSPGADRAAPVRRPDRRRGQREAGRRSPTTSPPSPATSCRSSRRRSGRASGTQTQQVIKAVKAGDWTRDGDDVVAGGAAARAARRRVHAAPGRRRRPAEHAARPAATASSCSTPR